MDAGHWPDAARRAAAGDLPEAEPAGPGAYRVALCCDRLLQGVCLEAKGFLPDDNYFHLVPGRRKVVCFTALADAGARFRATVEALNLTNPVPVRLTERPA